LKRGVFTFPFSSPYHFLLFSCSPLRNHLRGWFSGNVFHFERRIYTHLCEKTRAATHCNTLHHTATHCNTLQPKKNSTSREKFTHTSVKRHALQHTATHCNTLQHTATHCNTLQQKKNFHFERKIYTHLCEKTRAASHCNTLQHTATHCNTLQHTTTH